MRGDYMRKKFNHEHDKPPLPASQASLRIYCCAAALHPSGILVLVLADAVALFLLSANPRTLCLSAVPM